MDASHPHFARALLRWYERHSRDLPWRPPRGAAKGATVDPYRVLISEVMLQQTQVRTVIPYFERFLRHFPTVRELAAAPEQDVLRQWQGLGYYSRARRLQSAARQIIQRFAGQVPNNPEDLLSLPGIGRYTAGAIASIAFGVAAPILDGNVARVLCRLDRIESNPRDPDTRDRLWRRAAQILPRRRAGDFNSALMELGATICTPRSPDCSACPVQAHCRAFAANVQDRIPLSRASKPTPLLKRNIICIASNGKSGPSWLLEQRPTKSRWAGMWQFITFECNGHPPAAQLLQRELSLNSDEPNLIGRLKHALTHRRYEFSVYLCRARTKKMKSQRPIKWLTMREIENYPLPRPHVKVAQMLQSL